jgi:glycine cleavage system aminomethyltransferase T
MATGCEGVAAINTITSVMGINLDTLRPEPCVEGHSTPGGYSSKAVKPIALAKVPKEGAEGVVEGVREGRGTKYSSQPLLEPIALAKVLQGGLKGDPNSECSTAGTPT